MQWLARASQTCPGRILCSPVVLPKSSCFTFLCFWTLWDWRNLAHHFLCFSYPYMFPILWSKEGLKNMLQQSTKCINIHRANIFSSRPDFHTWNLLKENLSQYRKSKHNEMSPTHPDPSALALYGRPEKYCIRLQHSSAASCVKAITICELTGKALTDKNSTASIN